MMTVAHRRPGLNPENADPAYSKFGSSHQMHSHFHCRDSHDTCSIRHGSRPWRIDQGMAQCSVGLWAGVGSDDGQGGYFIPSMLLGAGFVAFSSLARSSSSQPATGTRDQDRR